MSGPYSDMSELHSAVIAPALCVYYSIVAEVEISLLISNLYGMYTEISNPRSSSRSAELKIVSDTVQVDE